jgi:chromosome segregation ATPase
VRDAEELAEQASAALGDAEQRAASARDRRHALRAELEQLERRLVAAQTEDTMAGRELREAQQRRDAAARAVENAQRRVERAKAKLRDLTAKPT